MIISSAKSERAGIKLFLRENGVFQDRTFCPEGEFRT